MHYPHFVHSDPQFAPKWAITTTKSRHYSLLIMSILQVCQKCHKLVTLLAQMYFSNEILPKTQNVKIWGHLGSCLFNQNVDLKKEKIRNNSQ